MSVSIREDIHMHSILHKWVSKVDEDSTIADEMECIILSSISKKKFLIIIIGFCFTLSFYFYYFTIYSLKALDHIIHFILFDYHSIMRSNRIERNVLPYSTLLICRIFSRRQRLSNIYGSIIALISISVNIQNTKFSLNNVNILVANEVWLFSRVISLLLKN